MCSRFLFTKCSCNWGWMSWPGCESSSNAGGGARGGLAGCWCRSVLGALTLAPLLFGFLLVSSMVVFFIHNNSKHVSAIKMPRDTISNTLLQLKCMIFIFIFQLCNAVRRVNQVSLERFLLLKLLFIACHYTTCLILEIFFFSYNFLQMEHLLLK